MLPTTFLPRCVIADDLRACRKLLESWVEECGFECDISASAEEAWEAILGSPPKLIITDIEMPGASGLELLYSLRNHPSEAIRSIPVIVISSLEDGEIRKFVDDAGGTCFLSKPLLKELTQRVVRGLVDFNQLPSEAFPRQGDSQDYAAKKISPILRRIYRDLRQNGPRFQ